MLGLERIGVHDDFFELGGHSLLAVRAAFRVGEAFGVEMPVAVLFQAPTIAELAEWLARAESRVATVRREDGEGASPLSFSQQRFWFLDRLRPGNPLYNLQVVVRLEGNLDVDVLGRALAEIVRRHEPLRTVYPDRDGEPFQEVLPAAAVPGLIRVSLGGLPAEARERALDAAIHAGVEASFDLRRGPVCRFLLIEAAPGERLLCAAFHHIATDGWSMGIFAHELAALYEASRRPPFAAPGAPPALRGRGRGGAARLAGPALQSRIGYWRGSSPACRPLASPRTARALSSCPKALARRAACRRGWRRRSGGWAAAWG